MLAPKFTFGIYDLGDVKQEGRFEAIKVLGEGKYDESRPLDKFLYTHVRNRYMNLLRNKYSRNEPPCLKCPFRNLKLESQCSEFTNKENCELWARWNKLNSAKRSLAKPGDLAVNDDGQINIKCNQKALVDTVEEREMLKLIDTKLPASMRSDFLKLKAGVKLPKERREEIYAAVKEIVNG